MIRTDALPQFQALRDELLAAAERVLASGWYVLGEEVARFEQDFARWLGARLAVGVASGTDALILPLLDAQIGPGDEVITVANTATATAMAIALRGATPVFVDVDPATLTIDPAAARAAVTARTRAIIAVHLYGHPADLEPLLELAREHNLLLIEDCAQAHGAIYRGRRVGCWAAAGAFSFYPTKNLGAFGDAGMIVTDDEELCRRLCALRQYGWVERDKTERVGMNSRLDPLQAALLGVKLPRLDGYNQCRRALAALYRERLASCPGLTLPVERADCVHVYHQFVIRHRERDRLRAWLAERGIGALIHYAHPLHLQAPFLRADGPLALPVTEAAAREVLSLPLYPEMPEADVQTVCDAVCAFCES